ncbi:MAG: hypothetical protein RSE41_07460 [Clostridia bacterium]
MDKQFEDIVINITSQTEEFKELQQRVDNGNITEEQMDNALMGHYRVRE